MTDEPRNAQWDLKKGNLYKIRSRNLPYGVYDGNGGFVGIREKFGELYLFTEYDYDQGAPYGTVVVREDLGAIPKEIQIVCGWFPGQGNATAGYKHNRELFDFLAESEKKYGRGIGFGGRPGDPEGKTPREIEEELRKEEE